MENEIVDLVNLGGSAEAANMTMWALFERADWVVKAVMIVLVLASIWSWAIIFDKMRRIGKLHRMAAKFEDAFWSGGSLDDLYDKVGNQPTHPMAAVFASAMREWRRSATQISGGGAAISLEQRIDRVMQVTLSREMDRLERYLPFLATVGSAAPFIGLFGTVWGIMNSFTAIAATKQTSLAVVAPGIAEALFATALGLIAAIPATVAYNKIANDLGRYGGRLDAFSGEFGAIISRQLEAGR